MSKREETKRIYSGTDADMLETAKIIHRSFLEDKTAFENFDPDFKDPFAEHWKLDIDSAESVSKRPYLSGELDGLSVNVENKMEECRNKFQTAKHFIEKAFPNNNAVWNEFGYNEYSKARQNQAKMIQFMQQFYNTAMKYKNELLAKNYSQAMIDEILSIKSELDKANQKQENFKKESPVMTQERINKLNICWDKVTLVARAGKLIFAKDFAKYQSYVISPGQEGEAVTTPPPPAPQP